MEYSLAFSFSSFQVEYLSLLLLMVMGEGKFNEHLNLVCKYFGKE